MILLEVDNKCIYDTLKLKFATAVAEGKIDFTNVYLADFDGVTYLLSHPEGDRSKLCLSISIVFFEELKKYGADSVLKREYGAYLAAAPQAGHNVTLTFDLTALPEDCDALASKAANLKRHCFASMFERFFQFYQQGQTGQERAVVKFRDDETLYIQAEADRVVVIFSTIFKDKDDVVIGKVFINELQEVRRRIHSAPSVLYSHRVPPAELEGTDAVVGDNVAYITFVLHSRHMTDAARDNTINLIHTLRNYLHYHIKCSKAYIHMRMRAKTTEFMRILNRAKPDYKDNTSRFRGRGGADERPGVAM